MALAYISLNDWAFFVALGVAPSLIWLWYYLKKDEHPEPKLMILKAFIFGFISTFLAFGLEFLFMKTVLGDGSACPECKYDLPKMLGLSAGKDFFVLSFVFLGVLAYIDLSSRGGARLRGGGKHRLHTSRHGKRRRHRLFQIPKLYFHPRTRFGRRRIFLCLRRIAQKKCRFLRRLRISVRHGNTRFV